MTLVGFLAALAAALNGLVALLLIAGWRAIRGQMRQRHRTLMLAALTTSIIFLATYLTRMAVAGPHRYAGEGLLRPLYYALLASHITLAAFTPPLAIAAVVLAWRERFTAHRKLARFALPIWLYVSATGMLVYVMLHPF